LTKYTVHVIYYSVPDIISHCQLLLVSHVDTTALCSNAGERRSAENSGSMREEDRIWGAPCPGADVQQEKEMTMVKQRFLKLSVSFFVLFVLMLSPLSVQTGFAQGTQTEAAEKAPFMYSLAATWEGKGIVRYRIAVQPAGDTVLEGLKIVAAVPAKGKVSVVTAGAAAAEDKVALSVDKTTPGKVPMLEYTVLTDAAGPDAVKPVSAEIFWKENGKDVSTKTETVGGDGFVGGKCTVIDKYARTPELPKYYPSGKDLGVLTGSWYEMGVQYGERSGREIVDFFDYRFGAHVNKYGLKHLMEDISRYEAQAKLFFPEGLEFARGIGDGAEKFLSQSKFHGDISNYLKIVFMNCDNCLFYGHPGPADADHGLPPERIADVRDPSPVMDACSMIALLGSKGATADGTSMLVHNNDGDFIDETWRYTYIAAPTGGNAFWSSTTPGKFFDIMGANNQGLAMALTVGGNKTWIPSQNIYERAFGVTFQYILLKALSTAKSVPEALELVTVATPEYRKATGRKTLLRTRHNNYIMLDKNEAAVVEVTANRYAIRRPGDNGEDPGYVVATNHFVANYSYDINNEKTDFPMTFFGDDEYAPMSATRYYTGFWQAKMNFGALDADKIRKIWTSHSYITKKGELVEKITNGKEWIPANLASNTICSHDGGYPESYIGSTTDTKIATVDFNQVRYSVGRPCEYEGMPRIFDLHPYK